MVIGESGSVAADRALPVFPPPRRNTTFLALGVLWALLAAAYIAMGRWPIAAMYLSVGLLWAARSRFGQDLFDPWAPRRKAKAIHRVAGDDQFAIGVQPPAPGAHPFEVRFEPPTRWTYVVRCAANSKSDAVARAHLALVYREKRGLNGWVSHDGVSGVNGARLHVDELPSGSPTDPWRVNYIQPDGHYFTR